MCHKVVQLEYLHQFTLGYIHEDPIKMYILPFTFMYLPVPVYENKC